MENEATNKSTSVALQQVASWFLGDDYIAKALYFTKEEEREFWSQKNKDLNLYALVGDKLLSYTLIQVLMTIKDRSVTAASATNMITDKYSNATMARFYDKYTILHQLVSGNANKQQIGQHYKGTIVEAVIGLLSLKGVSAYILLRRYFLHLYNLSNRDLSKDEHYRYDNAITLIENNENYMKTLTTKHDEGKQSPEVSFAHRTLSEVVPPKTQQSSSLPVTPMTSSKSQELDKQEDKVELDPLQAYHDKFAIINERKKLIEERKKAYNTLGLNPSIISYDAQNGETGDDRFIQSSIAKEKVSVDDKYEKIFEELKRNLPASDKVGKVEDKLVDEQVALQISSDGSNDTPDVKSQEIEELLKKVQKVAPNVKTLNDIVNYQSKMSGARMPKVWVEAAKKLLGSKSVSFSPVVNRRKYESKKENETLPVIEIDGKRYYDAEVTLIPIDE